MVMHLPAGREPAADHDVGRCPLSQPPPCVRYHPGIIRRYTYRVLRTTLWAISAHQTLSPTTPPGRLHMNMQTKMQDIVGLTKIAPFSRRGFMTASAASAAGFTLAAGRVRADAIKTDASGLTAGDAKVAVAGGDMPVYYARPASGTNPPVILVAMEIFGL